MRTKTKQKLHQKGWTQKEIQEAQASLEKAERHSVHFSRIVLWTALVVIIFTNIAVSLVLIPFLIVFTQTLLYSVVILLAGAIGFLYDLLIRDIGHLKRKHHLAAGIILPTLALVNMVVVVFVANNFITDLQVENTLHSPWIIGIVFAIAFILPYFLKKLMGRG